MDYKILADSLGSRDPINPASSLEQPFFSVHARLLILGANTVQVFEFEDSDRADQEAALISPDGSTVGNNRIGWVSPPHFYKKGRVIVLYVGSDSTLITRLGTVLGRQIAGL